MTCQVDYAQKQMDVAMPTFHLGFKCESWEPGEEAVRREITAELAAEVLFGESSALYQKLYEEALIDTSFGGGFETIDGMALFTASGDSNDPQAVVEAILARAKEVVAEGIDESHFLWVAESAAWTASKPPASACALTTSPASITTVSRKFTQPSPPGMCRSSSPMPSPVSE